MRKSMLFAVAFVAFVVSLSMPAPMACAGPEPGGGGGSGGTTIPYMPPTEISQSYSYGGIYVSGTAYNYENGCSARMFAALEQGVGGRYYSFESLTSSFYSYPESPGCFGYSGYARFSVLDSLPAETCRPLSVSGGMDMFGISLSSNATARNQAAWFWDEEKQTGWTELTDDIEVEAGFYLYPASIEQLYIHPGTYHDSYYGTDYLTISVSAYGRFLGEDAAAMSSVFEPVPAPEPATMGLVGAGLACLLLRRRRR